MPLAYHENDRDLGYGVAHVGDALSRTILTLAQQQQAQRQMQFQNALRLEEARRQQEMFGLRKEQFASQQGHYDAQAALDTEKQKQLESTRGVAQDAGLAAFGGEMSGVPNYTPHQASYLPNTPEVQAMLMKALERKALTESAALNPAASGRMVTARETPVNIPQGAVQTTKEGQILNTGVISAPLGNNVYQPSAAGVTPPLLQQGQARAGAQQGRSALEQIIIDAARALSSGNIEPDEANAALSLTNLLPSATGPLMPRTNAPAVSKYKVLQVSP